MGIEEGLMKNVSGYCLNFTQRTSSLGGPEVKRGLWKRREVTVDTLGYWCLLKAAEISTPDGITVETVTILSDFFFRILISETMIWRF